MQWNKKREQEKGLSDYLCKRRIIVGIKIKLRELVAQQTLVAFINIHCQIRHHVSSK